MINKKIAIIGLGYVGLPLAVEFGKKCTVVGFDINQPRINDLKNGVDSTLETTYEELKGKAEKELLPLQPGDVPDTYADVDDLVEEFGYKPSMSVKQGVENFAVWYKQYNNIL